MIANASNDSQGSFDGADYNKINALLDAAETKLLGLAVDDQLHGIGVERWRWDQPGIVMSWSPVRGTAGLGTNIRVYAPVGNSTRLACAVESNAWLDENQPDGSIIRHWDNFSGRAREIDDPTRLTQLESRWLEQQVERAYERIADGREFELSHAVLIFPDGHSQLLDASLRITDAIVKAEQ